MTTTLPTPGPQQPINDDAARMLVFDQIIGSDIRPGQPDTHIWNGDWHQELQTAAARWAPTGSQHTTIRARRLAAAVRAAIYLLHAALSLTAGYATYQATAPHLPVINANTAWFPGLVALLAVGLGLDPLIGRALKALGAPASNTKEAA
jgi:hypothetical protein